MSISSEYVELFSSIAKQVSLPAIEAIYLPTPIAESKKKDDFGIVILEDGSAGAFYISLDNTLEQLQSLYPEGENVAQECLSLIKNLTSDSLPQRAVALGAINAASQYMMSRAGFSAPDKKNSKTSSTGISQAKKGECIGMIGYFAPLIERLLEKEIEVLVLEKNPGRVEP
ncbi:MAG: Unknown protein [uncultured Thiotrichaceae bacterium]|uniref:Putative heavy-metal chelation domain-containing protein n=1 Tax=uncultured Thiotrichaceae bacterium TaxID=298394 RepID=A0A6S6TP38_9GAMM|nr:MAG: Unknown protein [uncultured Thiotrichaceae bacterium]